MSATRSNPAPAGDDLAHQTRKAPAGKVGSWDREARTFDAIISTGAAVERRSYSMGLYTEKLEISAKAVDLARFAAGMSLLDSHNAYSLDSRVGTIISGSVRIESGKLVATAKLSRNAKGEALATDLDDGHGLQLSVGYQIDEFAFVEASEGRKATLTATRWTPLEVSVVNVPADAGAFSRSHPKGQNMDDELETLEAPITPPAPARRSAPRDRADMVRPKATARRAFGERSGLRGQDLTDFVESTEGHSERETREAVLEKHVEIQERHPIFPIHPSRGLEGDAGTFNALSQAIRAKIQPTYKPTEARAQEFVGLSFTEIARRSLERAGGSTSGLYGGNVVDQALGRAFQTTSDFGPALGSAVRDILLAEFEQLQSPIAQAFRTESVPDFRELGMMQGLEGQDLLPVNEHGEFRRGMLVGESKEVARLGTYGRITPFSRQLLVNDQTGVIMRFIDDPARKAAELESNLMILQLESSTILMSDGLPLFDAGHKNIATSPSALTEASLNAAILAVEKGHKHANGSTIFQRPKYLIVPSEMRLVATKLLASVQATKTADVNPLANSLELIIEPRLTSPTAWYVAADPARSWGGVFLRLAGQEKPFIDYRTGFDVDGLEVKVRHDCGAGFADFRSWYKNPGA